MPFREAQIYAKVLEQQSFVLLQRGLALVIYGIPLGGETTQCIAAIPGNYSVVVTDENNCTASNSVTVSQVTSPSVSVSASNSLV